MTSVNADPRDCLMLSPQSLCFSSLLLLTYQVQRPGDPFKLFFLDSNVMIFRLSF